MKRKSYRGKNKSYTYRSKTKNKSKRTYRGGAEANNTLKDYNVIINPLRKQIIDILLEAHKTTSKGRSRKNAKNTNTVFITDAKRIADIIIKYQNDHKLNIVEDIIENPKLKIGQKADEITILATECRMYYESIKHGIIGKNKLTINNKECSEPCKTRRSKWPTNAPYSKLWNGYCGCRLKVNKDIIEYCKPENSEECNENNYYGEEIPSSSILSSAMDIAKTISNTVSEIVPGKSQSIFLSDLENSQNNAKKI